MLECANQQDMGFSPKKSLGGTAGKIFLGGVCLLVLQVLTLFQTKQWHVFKPTLRPGL